MELGKRTWRWNFLWESTQLTCHPINHILRSFANTDRVCLNNCRHFGYLAGNTSIQWRKLLEQTENMKKSAAISRELCWTCWFWGTWGSILILSNISKHMSSRNSSCIASRACHHLVNLKKQFRAELPTSTSHQQALWEALSLMWHNSSKWAVQVVIALEARHSPVFLTKKKTFFALV